MTLGGRTSDVFLSFLSVKKKKKNRKKKQNKTVFLVVVLRVVRVPHPREKSFWLFSDRKDGRAMMPEPVWGHLPIKLKNFPFLFYIFFLLNLTIWLWWPMAELLNMWLVVWRVTPSNCQISTSSFSTLQLRCTNGHSTLDFLLLFE